jgi:hypothetical protein
MILAVAALLLQFGPAVPAMPAAAAAAAKAAEPAPTISAPSLPDAPAPSSLTPNATPDAQPGAASMSSSQTAQHAPASLRFASLDPAGNDTGTLSTIRIPERNAKPFNPVSPEAVPSRKTWLMLSIAEHSAATFDAYSTRRALENGAHEADPIMRPFAGSPAIYAAIQVCPLVADFAARKMQRSQNNFVRHTWWLPQAVGAGVYLFSGAHNMQVAGER